MTAPGTQKVICQDVNFTLAGDVAVLGTGGVAGGTIGVIAQAGLISQAPTDYAQTDAGNIIFTAATNIVLGIVDARLDADRTGSVLGAVAVVERDHVLTESAF